MPATAAATPFAAPTRSHGRRENAVGAGSATTGEMAARRASRALLRSALLLFTLMEIPSPMLVDQANRTCSRRKEVLAACALRLRCGNARRMLVADLAPRETVMRTITDNKSCCEFATRRGTVRSLHRLSFAPGSAPGDAAALHRAGRRCGEPQRCIAGLIRRRSADP